MRNPLEMPFMTLFSSFFCLAIEADDANNLVAHYTFDEESGEEAHTQIQRALRELDIEYIAARSPQAKGRVERLFKTLQDRLVKALRRKKISTIAEANRYLEQEFVPEWRRRFAVEPASRPMRTIAAEASTSTPSSVCNTPGR